MRRRLVLFDIDGTLITDGGAAREAFADALHEVYGYDRDHLAHYDFSGRTDPQIAFMILRDSGFSDEAISHRIADLWSHYLGGLERNATPERVRVLPGISKLLDALSQRTHVTLALLTGNLETGARIKLDAPRLNGYFTFGAYGSDSAKREELPPIAVERASQIDGHRFAGRDVVIIGDSIYDVRCGVPHDATTIAIASGKTSAELLRAENPTHLFESAEERDALLEAICG
ncbi:MAG TPA: haloacid dehalogenase-like hydrolase [Thermoanaerobaculia bacterium]|jgi:phosphoglycolate phosphatase-like HAD superfamily hydrolase